MSVKKYSVVRFLFIDMMALKYSGRMRIGSHKFRYILVVKSIKVSVPACALQLLWERNACALCLQQESQSGEVPSLCDKACDSCHAQTGD